MATPVAIPKQDITAESCVITKWYKSEGDRIKKGELLFSYEADKSTYDVESPENGILLKVFYDTNSEVLFSTNVCVIGEAGENISEFSPDDVGASASPAEKNAVDVRAATTPLENISGNPDGKFKIPPRENQLAQKAGYDPSYASHSAQLERVKDKDTGKNKHIEGTGIGGMVTIADLEAQKSAVTADGEANAAELTDIRNSMGEPSQESRGSIAQPTLNTSFDATNIMAFHSSCKEYGASKELDKVSIIDMILFVAARTLTSFKDLNAHLIDDDIYYFKNVNLGVAVDTERGLKVPTLFNADLKSLLNISNEVKELATAARSGTLSSDYLKGGTFTIEDLSALGIESFTPVIQPPQTGILGVNTIVERIKVMNGSITTYPSMGLSLTFDQRAVEGAAAARFLKDLRQNLENFSLMLAV